MESKFVQNILSHKLRYGILVVLGIFVLWAGSSFSGIRNGGIARENALNTQYLDNQNYLSAYISGFYEQVSVLQTETAALDKILLDAVKGRYGKDGYKANGAFFAAIAEAYPELSAKQLLENWSKLQDYITSQRAGYRNIQSKLLDMLREYDTWRKTGLWKSLVNSLRGLPTEDLVARVGSKSWTGKAAKDKMYQIVLTSDAKKAYEDGTMDPLKVPSSTSK